VSTPPRPSITIKLQSRHRHLVGVREFAPKTLPPSDSTDCVCSERERVHQDDEWIWLGIRHRAKWSTSSSTCRTKSIASAEIILCVCCLRSDSQKWCSFAFSQCNNSQSPPISSRLQAFSTTYWARVGDKSQRCSPIRVFLEETHITAVIFKAIRQYARTRKQRLQPPEYLLYAILPSKLEICCKAGSCSQSKGCGTQGTHLTTFFKSRITLDQLE
jgi:hypothetical protein